MRDPVIVDKEMGLTHAEFFRVIALALAGRPHEMDGDGVRIAEDGRTLAITLGPEGERQIALLTLPVTRPAGLPRLQPGGNGGNAGLVRPLVPARRRVNL